MSDFKEEAIKIRNDILQCKENNSRLGHFLRSSSGGHCYVCVCRIEEALGQAHERGRKEGGLENKNKKESFSLPPPNEPDYLIEEKK